VLEEMGKAGSTSWFDAEANVVIDPDSYNGSYVVFGDNDFESVWQFVIDDWHIHRLRVKLSCAQSHHDDYDEELYD